MSGPSEAFRLVDDPASNLALLLGRTDGLRPDPVAAGGRDKS
jgi:hypothetical protein